MTRTTTSRGLDVSAASGRRRSAREFEDAMREIVRSDEPAVVLSSLARSSNSSFSDACAVELSEGADALFQVSFPMPDDAALPGEVGSVPPVAGKTVTTTFWAGSSHGYPAFAGVVVHQWIDRDPTEDDVVIARLLVDLALAIVQQERLAQSAARADDRAAKLAIELITSRVEGEAIGFLMAKHGAAHHEAVSLLRQASWTSQRRPHEVAADVVRSGDLDRLLNSRGDGPVRRSHLQVAASSGQTIATRSAARPASRAFDHLRGQPGA
jgi:hypothetical protein